MASDVQNCAAAAVIYDKRGERLSVKRMTNIMLRHNDVSARVTGKQRYIERHFQRICGKTSAKQGVNFILCATVIQPK